MGDETPNARGSSHDTAGFTELHENVPCVCPPLWQPDPGSPTLAAQQAVASAEDVVLARLPYEAWQHVYNVGFRVVMEAE